MKPHHHFLLRWFNEFRVKDKDEDDNADADSDDNLASNFLNRMVDQQEISAGAEKEVKVGKLIKAA